MPRVLLQAGHYDMATGQPLPPYTGAPGEALWVYDLAQRLAARLREAGVEVVIIGAWNDTVHHSDAPAEVFEDYDLFASLHYDGSTDPNATGCCAGRAALDPLGNLSDLALTCWIDVYPETMGIPLKQERVGVNITDYYGFRATSRNTPGILLEHGYGDCADHAVLFGEIEKAADADARAIADYLGVDLPMPSPEPAPADPCAAIQADRDFNYRLKMNFEAMLREPLYHKTRKGKTTRYVAVSEEEIQMAVTEAQG